MTNKAQTMLTIALTVAVSALLLDRIIEPAQAQSCASAYDVMNVETSVEAVGRQVRINQAMLEGVEIQIQTLQLMIE